MSIFCFCFLFFITVIFTSASNFPIYQKSIPLYPTDDGLYAIRLVLGDHWAGRFVVDTSTTRLMIYRQVCKGVSNSFLCINETLAFPTGAASMCPFQTSERLKYRRCSEVSFAVTTYDEFNFLALNPCRGVIGGDCKLKGHSVSNFTQDGDGVLGINFAGTVTSPFMSLISPWAFANRALLGLDINSDNSAMHIGGIDIKYTKSVVKADLVSYSSFAFRIYSLKLCNRNILSSNIIGYLVTSEDVLGLPASIFDNLLSFLPVSCTQKFACTLASKTVLPDLIFTITSSGSSVSINLNDLLDQNGLLKIVRYPELPAGLASNITFGTRILLDLYTVINMDAGLIGFAQKRNRNGNAGCLPVKSCIGMQRNVCDNPNCNYVFISLDSNSGYCKVSDEVQVAFVASFVIYLLIVIGYNIGQRDLQVKISTEAFRVPPRELL